MLLADRDDDTLRTMLGTMLGTCLLEAADHPAIMMLLLASGHARARRDVMAEHAGACGLCRLAGKAVLLRAERPTAD